MLCVSFSRTDSTVYIYHLSESSHVNLLHNSHGSPFPSSHANLVLLLCHFAAFTSYVINCHHTSYVTGVFHWSLCDNKFPNLSKIFFADHCGDMVRTVSCLSLNRVFQLLLVSPSHWYPSFFIPIAMSRYSSSFSLSFDFTL